jgi:hypothetical protein
MWERWQEDDSLQHVKQRVEFSTFCEFQHLWIHLTTPCSLWIL